MEYHFVSVPPRPPPCPRSLFALSGPCYGTTSSSIKCSPWHAWGRIPWACRWNPISLDPWTVVRARRSQGMPQHGAVSGAASTIDTRGLLPVVGRVKKGGEWSIRVFLFILFAFHTGVDSTDVTDYAFLLARLQGVVCMLRLREIHSVVGETVPKPARLTRTRSCFLLYLCLSLSPDHNIQTGTHGDMLPLTLLTTLVYILATATPADAWRPQFLDPRTPPPVAVVRGARARPTPQVPAAPRDVHSGWGKRVHNKNKNGRQVCRVRDTGATVTIYRGKTHPTTSARHTTAAGAGGSGNNGGAVATSKVSWESVVAVVGLTSHR